MKRKDKSRGQKGAPPQKVGSLTCTESQSHLINQKVDYKLKFYSSVLQRFPTCLKIAGWWSSKSNSSCPSLGKDGHQFKAVKVSVQRSRCYSKDNWINVFLKNRITVVESFKLDVDKLYSGLSQVECPS